MTTYWHIIPKRYQSVSFATFQPQTLQQKQACDYLMNATRTGLKQNILLLGNCGSGKTHLCYSFLKALRQPEKEKVDSSFCPSKICFMTTIKDILDEIKSGFKSDSSLSSSTLLQKAVETPILILDELGIQYGSDMERTELYRLFNERYNAMRPIIAVSNLDKDKLLSLLGRRICDRLFDNAVIFRFQGKSRRQEETHETH